MPRSRQDYYESLEESLQGGVTVVQIREKETDTGEFLDVALKSKTICDRVSRFSLDCACRAACLQKQSDYIMQAAR